MLLVKKIILYFSLSLFLASPLFAAGSRYVVEIGGRGTVDGGGVAVKVKIYQDDAKFNVSKLEDVDFKIRNLRDGDRCEQKTDKTDDNGIIEATCYATQTGSYNVYIKSNDKGDESGEFVISFGPKPLPTNTPTLIATATPTPEEEEVDEEEKVEALEDEESEEPTPTPTPQAQVAAFFSKPGNQIAFFAIAASLGVLIFIIWKTKLIDFGKLFKKKELEPFIKKPQDEENPPSTV